MSWNAWWIRVRLPSTTRGTPLAWASWICFVALGSCHSIGAPRVISAFFRPISASKAPTRLAMSRTFSPRPSYWRSSLSSRAAFRRP